MLVTEYNGLCLYSIGNMLGWIPVRGQCIACPGLVQCCSWGAMNGSACRMLCVVYMFWVQRHVLLLGEVCRLCVMSTVVMDFVYMQGFALLSTAYTTVAV